MPDLPASHSRIRNMKTSIHNDESESHSLVRADCLKAKKGEVYMLAAFRVAHT